jgi:hypothetical protein
MEIYAITDARGVIKYVGQSINAAKRQRKHWESRRRLNHKLAQWLRTLDAPPPWRLLVIVEDAEANRTERCLIAAARAAYPDDNLNARAVGGWAPEQRANLSRALTGIKRSGETRARMSVAQRGVKRDAATVEAMRQRTLALWADPAMREKMLASFRTPEARAQRSATSSAKRCSDETKAKIAAAKRAHWADPEYRRKVAAARAANKPSAETLAKRSAALKAAWDGRRRLDPNGEAFAAIARRADQGERCVLLAAELGVSPVTLYKALRKRRETADAAARAV